MPLDFTLAAFDMFCQRVRAVPTHPVADYLAQPEPPPQPFVIVRFDVDYRDDHALHLARIAERHHVRGSFYFRNQGHGFNWEIIQGVARLQHEVGYHVEALDRCQGDFDRARDLFLGDLEAFRSAGFPIRTVAAHGAPPTASTYRNNLDLFVCAPDLLSHTGLLGETTLSIDFSQIVYTSDANWRWRRYAHYQPGERGQKTSLRGILTALARCDAALYLNFHPHQWFSHPAETLYFRARNRIGRRLQSAITSRRT